MRGEPFLDVCSTGPRIASGDEGVKATDASQRTLKGLPPATG